MENTDSRHVISVILENESGALSRVSGLFSARGYNIESLTVAPTTDPSVSRMTIVTSGSDEVVTQITKQLNKLVDVITLVDLTDGGHIERELLLVKLDQPKDGKDKIEDLVKEYSGRFLDTSDETHVIEVTGSGSKLDMFLEKLDKGLIVEIVRTGASGIGKGSRVLTY
mgnify:CR=1 FL=1